MKKGFTLAEVLITLAIIGVVAALTIPSVIVRTQQQEFKTAAKKAHSVLSQAVQLTEVKDGYTFADEGYFIEALIKNMNVVKVEDGRIGYSLPGAAIASRAPGPAYGEGTVFYTADGIAYAVSYIDEWGADFIVDVNGDQGPSRLLEGEIQQPQCNSSSCDWNNPEWTGITLSDLFRIEFYDGASRILPWRRLE